MLLHGRLESLGVLLHEIADRAVAWLLETVNVLVARAGISPSGSDVIFDRQLGPGQWAFRPVLHLHLPALALGGDRRLERCAAPAATSR